MNPNLPTGETMSDGGAMPPMMDAPLMSGGEIPVPLKALAQPDDQEQMQTPAAGDPVTFTVDAQVTRVEGEMAYVKPSAVNGTPLDNEAAEPQPDDEAAEGEALRSMAAEQA